MRSSKIRALIHELELVGCAMLLPWRAARVLIGERREASWLYLWFALESLIMRPDSATRALWAVGRRGASSLLTVVRLAAIEVIVVMLASYVLALALRLIVRRPRAALDFSELASLMPWVFLPKLLPSAAFALAWALGVIPAQAMTFSGLDGHAHWTIAYHALGYGAVALAFIFYARAYARGTGEVFRLSPAGPEAHGMRALPLVVMLVSLGAMAWRVARDPARFRPIGRGDVIASLGFAPLYAAAAPLRLSFPRERPVVIDFWASWCGPCVEALPDWERLALDTTLAADFVSANVENETSEEVRRFLRERGHRFPVHAADLAVQARFQVNTYPTTIVIGADGHIREYWIGAVSANDIKRAIARAAAR